MINRSSDTVGLFPTFEQVFSSLWDRGITVTDLLDLLAIADGAADIARDLFASTSPGRLTEKADRDYATELDYAVEREVRQYLEDRTPDIGFLGEEEGAVNLHEGGTSWALDPVDGTSNLTTAYRSAEHHLA